MIEGVVHLLMGGLFVLSIVFHEYGHRAMARQLGYEANIYWEKDKKKLVPNLVTIWNSNNKEHELKILLSGVLLGLLPILASFFFLDLAPYVLLFPFAYYWLSRSDFKRINELYEEDIE